MKNLIKTKIFISTFLVLYFSFFVLTISILEIKSSGIGVGSMDYGFPFTYYSSHCFGGNYDWTGLIGNILFAAVLSFGIGIFVSFSWSNSLIPFWLKVSSPEFRAKWHI